MSRITLDSLPTKWRSKIVHQSETDCWIWTGARTTTPTPYAKVSVKGAQLYLHKHLWTLANPNFGPSLPQPRLYRQCPTELCVNPYHWHVDPFRPDDPWTPHILGRKRIDREAGDPDIPAPVTDYDQGDDLEIAIGLIESLLDYAEPASVSEICALPQFSGNSETIVATAAQYCSLHVGLSRGHDIRKSGVMEMIGKLMKAYPAV